MNSFSVATFNVWHGLAGAGAFRGIFGFREFENQTERRHRWGVVLDELREIDSDLMLFQELNPVARKGRELVSALGGRFFGRVDQSGVKILNRGFPDNLATGLGILVRGQVREARSREDLIAVPTSRKLSGGLALTGEEFSLQFDEQRYAQFLSVVHEKLGRLLIVNTHLHHGFERFPELDRLIAEAFQAGRISRTERESLNVYLDRSRDRRLKEIDRMLEVVSQVETNHDGVIIGGDFNSLASGAAIQTLKLAGFIDLAMKVGNEEPTWDPTRNAGNHLIQKLKGFDFPLPDFGNRALRDVYRKFDQVPRRIDYLWGRGSVEEVSRVKIFGVPKAGEAGPSDHFGVVAYWDFR